MKCVKVMFFSMLLITAAMFGPAGFAQQESSASAAKTDEPASHTGETVKDSEIKEIPVSAESENADKAGEVSPEKSNLPESREEKKIAVSPEKSDIPQHAEEKNTSVSPEKTDAPESGEEKKPSVSEDKTGTSEHKKAQESALSPKTFSVQVNKANVRNEASLGAKINAQLKKGQAVTVIEVKDDWYHIQLDDGEQGWVHGSTLGEKTVRGKDIKPGDSIALTVNGNIRNSPDLTSEILTVLKKGDTVVIMESGEEWYQVQLADGRDGWAHKKLFAKRAPVRLYDLDGIRIEKAGKNEEKVYFLYKGPKPPHIFISKAGSTRIVCDFSNTRPGKGIGQKTEVKGSLIQTVRTGLHGEDQSDLRVVFDVVPDSEYGLEHFFVKKEMYLLIVKKQ